MGPELTAALETFAKEGRVVLTAQLLRQRGVPPAATARAVKGKELQRPVKGIYVRAGAPLVEEVLAKVALEHAGEGAVLTGLMAARWLKLKWVPAATEAHVLVAPERRRRSTEGIVLVRRCRWVDELACVVINGCRWHPWRR